MRGLYVLALTRSEERAKPIFMRHNYNNKRRRLYLPEYGRHIHEMVDHLMTIEDRDERNRQAKAVIAVMGNLQPLLRDTADFTHKLWDHLFIMSDFQLDVDSPYPRPTRDELQMMPRKLEYSQGRIPLKHYGKNVALLMQINVEYTDGTRAVIATDYSWLAAGTNVAAEGIVFANIYDGQTIDARLRDNTWTTVAYKGEGWTKATVLSDFDTKTLIPTVNEPVVKNTQKSGAIFGYYMEHD